MGVREGKKKLDAVFSTYIRLRDAGICFTCGNKKEPKYQQNGHYVPREHNATRYDEQNCHCQCVGCNVFKHGNMDEYALRLKRKYGDDILEVLNERKKQIKKFTPKELEEKIKYYKDLICNMNG